MTIVLARVRAQCHGPFMNATTKYRVTMASGETWTMLADMTTAGAPIQHVTEDGTVESTPHQTADARHDAARAAELVAAWWARQSGEADEVTSVERQAE